jgi:hypothetical protein
MPRCGGLLYGGGATSSASAPAARASDASRDTTAVSLPPHPAITGMRRSPERTSSTTTSTARRCSSGDMAEASPVLPLTTSASVPPRR